MQVNKVTSVYAESGFENKNINHAENLIPTTSYDENICRRDCNYKMKFVCLKIEYMNDEDITKQEPGLCEDGKGKHIFILKLNRFMITTIYIRTKDIT